MTSPYIAIPVPHPNLPSLIASMNALIQDVNLLIVNSQETKQTPNLVGANVFSQVQTLAKQVSTVANQVTTLNAQLNILSQQIIGINARLRA